MADLYNRIYNPDILSCLANLSNDEVFTPPEVANAMLDLLPQELFSDPNTTFLDPACKSGVFLREIAKRLLVGLEPVIPDLQERTDHIFQKQLFGIAITEANRNFSKIARMVDENGPVVILKNNSPRYLVMDFSEAEKEQTAADEDVLAVSACLIAKNREAYEVLAK